MALDGEQVNALLRGIAPKRVLKAQGHSHVPAYDVIAHLNRVFGFGGWEKTILALDIVHERSIPPQQKKNGDWDQGRWWVTYSCRMRLTIKDPAGVEVASYEDAATGSAQNMPSPSEAYDFAIKNAVSYALKRCAKDLGDQFGLSLYNGGMTDALVRTTLVQPTAKDEPPADLEDGVPAPVSMGNDEVDRGSVPEEEESARPARPRLVQSDPRHAGRVVPAAPDVAECEGCGHAVADHGGLGASAGCSRCACAETFNKDRGVASVDQREGSAAAVAVNDEVTHVEAEPPPPEPEEDAPLPNPASEAQFRRIHASLTENKLGDDARHCIISFVTGMRTTSSRELTSDEASVVLNLIGQVRLGRLSVEQRDGEWVVYALDDAGVRFLKQAERRVVPSRGRGGITRPADEGNVEPLSDEEVAGAI